MDFILGLIASVVGIIVFIQVLTLVIITSRLVKLQFWEPVIALAAPGEEVETRLVLDAGRPVLEQHGFVYVHTRRTRLAIVAATPIPVHSDIYYNAEHDVHAELSSSALPTPRWPFGVSLLNYYTDGRVLLTVNGLAHVLSPFPGNITIADAYAPNFGLQLAHHLAQRADMAGERATPDQAHARAAAMASELMPAVTLEGKMYRMGVRDGEPVYGMRLITALKMAWRMRLGAKRSASMDAPAGGGDQHPALAAPEVRFAAERWAFVGSLCTLNSMQAPRWFRWSAFAITAGGFIALGAWWWGLTVALVIAGVLAVHEAGHWLAMRKASFRDVQVFFVPGMGAATSGEKHDASPLTHLAVYLAGPLPGLLLGIAAAAWMVFGTVDANAWWYPLLMTAIRAALLINLLNLLPVMPLDGGRVVDLFVMGRLPWMRFVFAIGSAAALLWAGIASGDNVLRTLGILLFFGVPHQYQMAKVSADLLRQKMAAPLASEGFAHAAGKLYDFLAQPAYQKWSHQAKLGVGQTILPRFLGRLPNAKETAFGLIIYIACIAAPLAALGVMAMKDPMRIAAIAFSSSGAASADPSVHDPLDEAALLLRTEREATLAGAAPAQRIAVLGSLADEASALEDYTEALRLAKLLYAETALLPPPSREHAHAAFRMAGASSQEQDPPASVLLTEAETILRKRLAAQADSVDALLLAQVLERQTYRLSDKDALLSRKQEIVDLRAAHQAQAGYTLTMARTELARSLDLAGQIDLAEKQLKAAADDFKYMSNDTIAYFRSTLMLDHAWFLMAHERPDEALQMVREYLGKIDAGPSVQSFHQRDAYLLAAVAARARGDWQEVKVRASAIQYAETFERDNWFVATFMPGISRTRLDPGASLLLLEAQRALGDKKSADALADDIRKEYQDANDGKVHCRFQRQSTSWRKGLDQALAENEGRELKCATPASSCR
jgi:Zn-dependent protease